MQRKSVFFDEITSRANESPYSTEEAEFDLVLVFFSKEREGRKDFFFKEQEAASHLKESH